MGRVLLLVFLLVGTTSGFVLMHSSEPEAQEKQPTWDMRKDIQNASDDERNPWRREM